jgi:hypothetical protein
VRGAPRFTMRTTADEHVRSIGAQLPCTRQEIRIAFAYSRNARVKRAVWLDENRTAIAISVRSAELHWYEESSVGKREVKRKRYLD